MKQPLLLFGLLAVISEAFVLPPAARVGSIRSAAKHQDHAPQLFWRAPQAAVTGPCELRMAGGGIEAPVKPAPSKGIGFDVGGDEKNEDNNRPEDKFKVMLFDDQGNTREYVSRSLVNVVGLSEGDAYNCMQQAHTNGMAVVGVWHQELADAYCDGLKGKGLVSDVFPVGEG